MALNALTLSVTSGIQGRPFKSAVSGLTAGSIVDVTDGATPGVGYSNGFAYHAGLPYDLNVVELRERVQATGENRVSRLLVTAVSEYTVKAQALASTSMVRGFRSAPVVQSDGSLAYSLFVEDVNGATATLAVTSGGGAPTPTIDNTPSNSTLTGSQVSGFVSAANALAARINALFPPVTLGILTLSGSLQIGTAASGTISGASTGSSIASNIPGITVNSGARTYSGTPTGSAQTIANGLVETLTGAVGSPASSSVTVAAASTTTNLFRYSQQFDNAYWAVTGTVTPDNAAAPDSTTTADTLTAASGYAQVGNNSSPITTAPSTLTVSFYFKRSTAGEQPYVQANCTTDGFKAGVQYFNIDTLSSGGSASLAGDDLGFTNVAVTSAGNGWFRCSCSFSGSGSSQIATFLGFSDATGSRSATNGRAGILWGAQAEVGSLSNYVATT